MDEEKRLKEEVDNDKRCSNKHLDDSRLLHLENAKMEMEMECKERMSKLQTQLTESKKKVQEMEYQSSRLKGSVREKDEKWQKGLTALLKEFKVILLRKFWLFENSSVTYLQHLALITISCFCILN